LNRSRSGITSELDVIEEILVKGRATELCNWCGCMLAGNFNGDIFIFVKVDSSLTK